MINNQPVQLPLEFTNKDRSFKHFIADNDNSLLAINLIKKNINSSKYNLIYLWSRNIGVGLSHLLHASCNYCMENHYKSLYLDGEYLHQQPIEILDQITNIDLICIDNIHFLVTNTKWEKALFNLINHAVTNNINILTSGNDSLHSLAVQLPDLHTRLKSGISCKIIDISETSKIKMLQKHAITRGFSLDRKIAAFILKRCNRDNKSLIDFLNLIDKTSLSNKKKISMSLVSKLL